MQSLFSRLTGRGPASKDIAKDRLKLALSYDRADVSPAIMEQMKDEIIAVIDYTDKKCINICKFLAYRSEQKCQSADFPTMAVVS